MRRETNHFFPRVFLYSPHLFLWFFDCRYWFSIFHQFRSGVEFIPQEYFQTRGRKNTPRFINPPPFFSPSFFAVGLLRRPDPLAIKSAIRLVLIFLLLWELYGVCGSFNGGAGLFLRLMPSLCESLFFVYFFISNL